MAADLCQPVDVERTQRWAAWALVWVGWLAWACVVLGPAALDRVGGDSSCPIAPGVSSYGELQRTSIPFGAYCTFPDAPYDDGSGGVLAPEDEARPGRGWTLLQVPLVVVPIVFVVDLVRWWWPRRGALDVR